MSTIETRGYLPSGDKIYGPIYDRFIIGRNAVKLNFSVLPITDPKKDFNFYDCVIDEANFNTAFDTAFAPAVSNVLGLPKVKADDKYNPPLFFSTCSPGYRAFRQNFTSTSVSNSSYMINQGYFKRTLPIFNY